MAKELKPKPSTGSRSGIMSVHDNASQSPYTRDVYGYQRYTPNHLGMAREVRQMDLLRQRPLLSNLRSTEFSLDLNRASRVLLWHGRKMELDTAGKWQAVRNPDGSPVQATPQEWERQCSLLYTGKYGNETVPKHATFGIDVPAGEIRFTANACCGPDGRMVKDMPHHINRLGECMHQGMNFSEAQSSLNKGLSDGHSVVDSIHNVQTALDAINTDLYRKPYGLDSYDAATALWKGHKMELNPNGCWISCRDKSGKPIQATMQEWERQCNLMCLGRYGDEVIPSNAQCFDSAITPMDIHKTALVLSGPDGHMIKDTSVAAKHIYGMDIVGMTDEDVVAASRSMIAELQSKQSQDSSLGKPYVMPKLSGIESEAVNIDTSVHRDGTTKARETIRALKSLRVEMGDLLSHTAVEPKSTSTSAVGVKPSPLYTDDFEPGLSDMSIPIRPLRESDSRIGRLNRSLPSMGEDLLAQEQNQQQNDSAGDFGDE